MTKRLSSKLKTALNEKDVENIYREELSKFYEGASITSPFGSDGLLEFLNEKAKNLKMLLEFKYKDQLKGNIQHCSVLVQCLYYIKKFENSGQKLPNVIFVGDENECFALHTNAVIKYLAMDIDWSIAPSEAAKRNPEVVMAMVKDQDIAPFIFDVNDNFNFKDVVDKIDDLNKNVVRLIRVTHHNINAIFDYFMEHVMDDKELSPNQCANLFIQLLINPQENYLHPTKKNTLVTKTLGEIRVKDSMFKSFFSHFEHSYSPKEKEALTAIVDRLVEDSTRRKQGEFFTPTLWVDEGHKLLSQNLGEDWKEKYVVWDCAAGTLNLTRDYRFKELYCSTLVKDDIDTANQMGYNPEAVKFQYDFLNEGEASLIEKAPGLVEALRNDKPILFLINPPYATSSKKDTTTSTKDGTSNTKIGELMKKEGWLSFSQNLYTQFLFKIYKIKEKYSLSNIEIALYSPSLFLTGSSWKKFRANFNRHFSIKDGFLFQASEFSDVDGSWGIVFTQITSLKTNESINTFKLKKLNTSTFEIEDFGNKTIYNTDGEISASEWVKKEANKNRNKHLVIPHMKSALNVRDVDFITPSNGHLACFVSLSNSIYKNVDSVFITSGMGTAGNAGGFSIIKENLEKTISLFTARRSITGKYTNWINQKDEYLAPNEDHPLWSQFVKDSLVYSLFNNSSQQSSLRKVKYKDSLWDIKNEFFWLSVEKMKDLANEYNYDALYNDTRAQEERHVYKLLMQEGWYNDLSPDAKAVLDKATELLEKSILQRQLLDASNPEYHLSSWDAGYAQLKLVWQEYFKEEFKEFRNLYKVFEDRMRPIVYEVGFLRK